MRSLAVRCVRRDTWPDTEAWARAFLAQPARTPRQLRHQFIVASLLTRVGAR